MRVTGVDALAMAPGAVAVVFSGFVFAHSAWGGAAVLLGGALSLSVVPIRVRLPAAAPVVWIGFCCFSRWVSRAFSSASASSIAPR